MRKAVSLTLMGLIIFSTLSILAPQVKAQETITYYYPHAYSTALYGYAPERLPGEAGIVYIEIYGWSDNTQYNVINLDDKSLLMSGTINSYETALATVNSNTPFKVEATKEVTARVLKPDGGFTFVSSKNNEGKEFLLRKVSQEVPSPLASYTIVIWALEPSEVQIIDPVSGSVIYSHSFGAEEYQDVTSYFSPSDKTFRIVGSGRLLVQTSMNYYPNSAGYLMNSEGQWGLLQGTEFLVAVYDELGHSTFVINAIADTHVTVYDISNPSSPIVQWSYDISAGGCVQTPFFSTAGLKPFKIVSSAPITMLLAQYQGQGRVGDDIYSVASNDAYGLQYSNVLAYGYSSIPALVIFSLTDANEVSVSNSGGVVWSGTLNKDEAKRIAGGTSFETSSEDYYNIVSSKGVLVQAQAADGQLPVGGDIWWGLDDCWTFLGGTIPVPPPAPAKWTFMVYLDADNNLDAWAYQNLELMEEVGSTEEVNIVILWDGYYMPANLYKVVPGDIELVSGFPLNGTEVNMGDPETLEAFVDFVTVTFTADHYFLDLWDHGNSFLGGCVDEHTNVPGVARDRLYNNEVAWALEGHHIDIIAWDACLMAMMEVAYEYVALGVDADYLVGSENYVPVYGYPYNVILNALVEEPEMSGLDFAITVASEYAEYYRPRAHWNGGVMATLSVIDLDFIMEAAAELSALITLLKTKLEMDFDTYRDLISEARGDGNLPWAEYGWEYYVDLPSFTLGLLDRTSDEDIRALAGQISDTLINETIKYVGNTKPMESVSALGIGIWFPPSFHSIGNANQAINVLARYSALQFESTGWLDFLYTCWKDSHGGGRGGRKR